MPLDVANAQGAMTGARFRASLQDGRKVYLNGQQVEVTTHPAFAGLLGELCRLYDLQHTDENREVMTFAAPSGRRLSTNYLLPTNAAQLAQRRANAEQWSRESWGLLTASPEFMASALVGLYDFRNALGAKNAAWGKNAEAYVQYAAENDLFVTHSIAEPQVTRSELYPGQEIRPGSELEVVEERADGIVVRGVRNLTTMAPLANEVFVFYTSQRQQEDSATSIQWFALPLNAPGVSILCSEPRSPHSEADGHPLVGRYGEFDAAVFFDNVFVPNERVFLLGEQALAQHGLDTLKQWLTFSGLIRKYYHMWSMIGVATMLTEANGTDLFRNMRDKLGEMVLVPEVYKTALGGTEVEAKATPGGLFCPTSLLPVAIFSTHYADRLVGLVKDLAGAAVVLQPSEADLANDDLRPLLEEFMASRNLPVAETARLFRIAWDIIGDGTGVRRDLYDRWLLGDQFSNKNAMFLAYDRSDLERRIKDQLANPLPVGDAPPVWSLMNYN